MSKTQDATNKSVIDLTKENGLTWLIEEFQTRGMNICESATNNVGERADPVECTPPIDSMKPIVVNVADHMAMATQVLPTKH